MTTKKNYIYEDREYGDVARRRSKVDVQGREVPLSELDKPYLKNNEYDDTYQSYEEEYGDCVSPPCPDINIPPDPIRDGPCSSPDGCGHVKIMRDFPATMDCGSEYWFRTVHEVHGCEGATGEAAFLAWGVSAGEILSQAVGMKWRAPDCCGEDEILIHVSDAGNRCTDSVVITLECCCEQFTISGPATMNPYEEGVSDGLWIGTVDPPCGLAELTVESTSGCTLESSFSSDGKTIRVQTGPTDCGTFVVTLDAEAENCDTLIASITVRINDNGENGGAWTQIFRCGGFVQCTRYVIDEQWRRTYGCANVGSGCFCYPPDCYPGYPGGVDWWAGSCSGYGPYSGEYIEAITQIPEIRCAELDPPCDPPYDRLILHIGEEWGCTC